MTRRLGRRTQSERTQSTRSALLDATIESLAEVGYTATTTRALAARAGVTHGAQQHHYGTKLGLVDAALNQFAQTLADDGPAVHLKADAEAAPGQASVSEWDRCAHLLDALWELHKQPLVGAIAEMLALSRTDLQIRERLGENTTTALLLARISTAQALPVLGGLDGFGDWILTVLAAIRGLAVTVPLDLPGEAALPWPAMREHLLAALRAKAVAHGVELPSCDCSGCDPDFSGNPRRAPALRHQIVDT